MALRSLLIFDHDGARFGVDAALVRESVWLPELTPVEEAPPWIVGLFSLRGRIIPVADLHLRFEHPARRYSVDDHVVVLEADRMPLGLIVSEVLDVIDLPVAAIQPPPQFDAQDLSATHLVTGEVRVDDELVTLLDVPGLARLPEGAEFVQAAEQIAPASYFSPQASGEERALFRTRAKALRENAAEVEGARRGLAVVELAGEYFGVELTDVLEFCTITELCPIPCCPPHILGAMNLRGDLLTLIDPCSALNLSSGRRGDKAVVTLLKEQSVAIAVDQVHDVIYLREEELQTPPAVLLEQCGSSIAATAPYAGGMMTLLDLPALLAREEWIVNENV